MTPKQLALLFLLLPVSAMAQNNLILQHKKKPHKIKAIDLEREFEIKTIDDTTYYTQIVGFGDSTILISLSRKTGKDTVYVRTSEYTTYSKSTFFQIGERQYNKVVLRDTVPLYRTDTTAVLFTDIHTIKKDWFKNRRWLEPFGWCVIGAGLGVIMLPVVAIEGEKQDLKDWVKMEGLLLGTSGSAIFIGTRKKKYDLNRKWTLAVR